MATNGGLWVIRNRNIALPYHVYYKYDICVKRISSMKTSEKRLQWLWSRENLISCLFDLWPAHKVVTKYHYVQIQMTLRKKNKSSRSTSTSYLNMSTWNYSRPLYSKQNNIIPRHSYNNRHLIGKNKDGGPWGHPYPSPAVGLPSDA